MTILIHFHQSYDRNFKAYSTEYVLERLRPEFPGLVSYHRFVEFIPSGLTPLCVYLRTRCLGTCTGISFIDSTLLGSVQKSQNPLPQGLYRAGGAWQNLDRLVF
jgi:hypothetical protein